MHEKGKNSIGLQGGVSGLAGAFVGLNYSTNNFLGLGETLSVQASLGSRQRDLVFGFTEPYLFDRPSRPASTSTPAKPATIRPASMPLPPARTEFALRLFAEPPELFAIQHRHHRNHQLPLRKGHSFKRVGIAYSFDRSSLVAVSNASKLSFENLNFRGITGTERPQRHHHQQDHSQLHHEYARRLLRSPSR